MIIAWILFITAGGWAVARFWKTHQQRKAREQHRRRHAMDVFTLHPGTTALLCHDTGKFLGYLLPSGRIVQQRYWRQLDGVAAEI